MNLFDAQQMLQDAVCPHCREQSSLHALLKCGIFDQECIITAECGHCQSEFVVSLDMASDHGYAERTIECNSVTSTCEIVPKGKKVA